MEKRRGGPLLTRQSNDTLRTAMTITGSGEILSALFALLAFRSKGRRKTQNDDDDDDDDDATREEEDKRQDLEIFPFGNEKETSKRSYPSVARLSVILYCIRHGIFCLFAPACISYSRYGWCSPLLNLWIFILITPSSVRFLTKE